MRKLLFLDVDGVLNNAGDYESQGFGALGLKRMRLLKAVVEIAGCEIVISSSWRHSDELLSRLEKAFDKFELSWVGLTDRSPEASFRRDEITAWLRRNIPVGEQLIVGVVDDDDDADLGLDLGFSLSRIVARFAFFETDWLVGLTSDIVNNMVAFFTSKDDSILEIEDGVANRNCGGAC